MEQLRVYIVNKEESETEVGAWFVPPINIEDLEDSIGPAHSQGYHINAYTNSPLLNNQELTIENINKIHTHLQELVNEPFYEDLELLMQDWFYSIDDLIKNKDKIVTLQGNSESIMRDEIMIKKVLGEVSEEALDYIFPDYYFERQFQVRKMLEGRNNIYEYIE